jgi:hypothetical protein
MQEVSGTISGGIRSLAVITAHLQLPMLRATPCPFAYNLY